MHTDLSNFADAGGLRARVWTPQADVVAVARIRRLAPVFRSRFYASRLLSLVVGLGLIVHAAAAEDAATTGAAEPSAQAAEMRDLILAAVQSGEIEDLRQAFDHGSGKPDFGAPGESDPIAALKRASADGTGLDVLAAMGEALRMPPAALPLGKDLENNLIYVWPYLAEKPLDKLTNRETVDLLSLVAPAKVVEMREKKRWLWWRLAIGADGAWLMFKKAE